METSTPNPAVEQFLARVRSLLADCRQWAEELGLHTQVGATTIQEERLGTYEAPTLKLLNASHQPVAEMIPFGAGLIGALGRVDVLGHYGKREKIVYLSQGGPVLTSRIQIGADGPVEESSRPLLRGIEREGWYWVSPYPMRRAFPLTREVWVDLLNAVSGHGFPLQ
jgi:hypothetical protein